MVIETCETVFELETVQQVDNGILYRLYCEPLWEECTVVEREESVFLRFRAENAETFEDYFSRICLDLENPQLVSELYDSDNELWIEFSFRWTDDESEFKSYLERFKEFI